VNIPKPIHEDTPVTKQIDIDEGNTAKTVEPSPTSSHAAIIPPWEQDGWQTKLTEENLEHLHNAF